MKSLAFVALFAVPRPALELLAGKFHGWRKLLRSCLTVIVDFVCLRQRLMLAITGGLFVYSVGRTIFAWRFGI